MKHARKERTPDWVLTADAGDASFPNSFAASRACKFMFLAYSTALCKMKMKTKQSLGDRDFADMRHALP